MLKCAGKKNIYNVTLKFFVYLNLCITCNNMKQSDQGSYCLLLGKKLDRRTLEYMQLITFSGQILYDGIS